MNVTGAQLLAQYQRGLALWPWVGEIERAHGLLPFLLWATGSRETGLNPEYAQGKAHDDGHGWGLLGADDRWNTLDLPSFASDPRAQFELAASTLERNRKAEASWLDAVNAYGPEWARPGYGEDVLGRATYLLGSTGVDDDPPAELDNRAAGHGTK